MKFFILTLFLATLATADRSTRRLTQKVVITTRTTGKCDIGDIILTKSECESAAQLLGLDTSGSLGLHETPSAPYGCTYTTANGLYFQTTKPDSSADCTSRDCLCRITCASSTHQDTDGQTSCKNCPTGRTGGVGASSCDYDANSCPIGQFPSGTSTVCEICIKGKYNDQTGQASCIFCGAGKYSDITEQTSESDCKSCAASLVSAPDFSECVKPGEHPTMYVSIDGSGGTATNCVDEGGESIATIEECNKAAKILDLADTSAQVGDPQYTNAPDGCIYSPNFKTLQYRDIGTSSGRCQSMLACVCKRICQAGHYQDMPGQTTCKKCEIGKYNDQVERSRCKSCEKGKYSKQEGQTSKDKCKSCVEGEYIIYNAETEKTTCEICADGMYTTDIGQSECVGCPAGRYLKDPQGIATLHNELTDCQICIKDEYQDQLGQSTCKQCKFDLKSGKQLKINDAGRGNGSYEYHDEANDCSIGGITCRSGESYFDGACIECEKGTQVSDDKSFCTLCPTGFYQNQLKQKNCKECTIPRDSVCALMSGAVSEQKTDSAVLEVLVLPENDEAEMMALDLDYNSLSTSNKELSTECAASRSSILLYQEGMDQGTQNAVYAGLCTLAAVVVLTHRFLPEKARSFDLMFAKVSPK